MIEWIMVIWIAINGQVTTTVADQPSLKACRETVQAEVAKAAVADDHVRFLCIFRQET